MLKPLDLLTASGQPGLDIFIIREIKPPSKGIAAVKVAAEQNYELDYEAIRIPEVQYGAFFSEELYVILKTTKDSHLKHVHIWFGKDYSETPPPWIDNLQQFNLYWKAILHFEVQHHECELFESYFTDFQPALRYMDGKLIPTNAAVSRFYKVTKNDRGIYRIKEIPFDLTLMNQEDCFILDTSYNTRAYISNSATKRQRKKTIEVANAIREQHHDGNGNVDVVDLMTFTGDGNRESCMQASEFLENIPLDDDNEEDVKKDDRSENAVMHEFTTTCILMKESNSEYPPRFTFSEESDKKKKVTLSAKIKFICRYGLFYLFGKKQIQPDPKEIPKEVNFVKIAMKRVLLKEHLESKRVYLLEESVRRGAYIWVGNDCDKKLQTEVTHWVNYELRRGMLGEPDPKKPLRWIHVMKIPEGEEPPAFRQYFQDWTS